MTYRPNLGETLALRNSGFRWSSAKSKAGWWRDGRRYTRGEALAELRKPKVEVVKCKEAVMGLPMYIPHGVPATCIVYWPSGEECLQCDMCADHSVRNRGAKRRELP